MKLRILSDLHNECLSTVDAINLIPVVEGEKDQVLVLAGDIFVIHKAYTFIDFLNAMCGRFKHVVFVPGNHEYYSSRMPLAKEGFYGAYTPPTNFTWLDGGNTVRIEGTLFVGETLWTDFHGCEQHEKMARSCMNDYRLIKLENHQRITPEDIKKEHEAALSRLEESIEEGCVVVSHHGICEQSVAPMYENNPLNPAFYSELTPWLEKLPQKPRLWIHGHTHSSFDYDWCGVRVVVNPRGYPNHRGTFENPAFDARLVISI